MRNGPRRGGDAGGHGGDVVCFGDSTNPTIPSLWGAGGGGAGSLRALGHGVPLGSFGSRRLDASIVLILSSPPDLLETSTSTHSMSLQPRHLLYASALLFAVTIPKHTVVGVTAIAPATQTISNDPKFAKARQVIAPTWLHANVYLAMSGEWLHPVDLHAILTDFHRKHC